MRYAITQQALISFIPVYVRACPSNLLGLKPHPGFAALYLLSILVQVSCLNLLIITVLYPAPSAEPRP